MTAFEVRPVPIDHTASDRVAFDGLPDLVYARNPHWAPDSVTVAEQLWKDAATGDVEMNAVVASRGEHCVARAAAITVPGDSRIGWIGLIECLPGEQPAGMAVVDACRSRLIDSGATTIRAPQSSSLVAGLLCAGFDEPQSFLTPYNPPWYGQILREAGLVVDSTMVAFAFTRSQVPDFAIDRSAQFRVRPVDAADLVNEVARIHDFQEAVFAGHPGHQVRALGQTRELAQRLLPVLDPDLVLLAEDAADRVIGLLLCTPDAWQRRPPGDPPTHARLISLGVADTWRHRGVAVAMGAQLADTLLAKGYERLEASVVMSDNEPPLSLATALGARIVRRFEVYGLADHSDR